MPGLVYSNGEGQGEMREVISGSACLILSQHHIVIAAENSAVRLSRSSSPHHQALELNAILSRMEGHIERWQKSLQHDDNQLGAGTAAQLFKSSADASSTLLRIMAADTKNTSVDIYESLRHEFQSFYVWNEGFSTGTGELDRILFRSKDLKATVLGLMAQWAKSLLKSGFLHKRSLLKWLTLLQLKFPRYCEVTTGLRPL